MSKPSAAMLPIVQSPPTAAALEKLNRKLADSERGQAILRLWPWEAYRREVVRLLVTRNKWSRISAEAYANRFWSLYRDALLIEQYPDPVQDIKRDAESVAHQRSAPRFIPKGGMCAVCGFADRDCSALPFPEYPPIFRDHSMNISVVRCLEFVHHKGG